MVTYNTAESAMDNLFNWIMNSPNNTMVSMVVSCNYSGESVSGSLNAGAFLLVGYRRHTYANITAYSYWNSRSMSIATIEDNSWTKRFDRVITNTDLGNATFWFPTFVLGWDSYTNGTHQLTQSIANKPLLICAGKNGSLSGFWARTQANDDRVIMTPEGAITIHFDSLTQVTITGATSTWNVRSIQIF